MVGCMGAGERRGIRVSGERSLRPQVIVAGAAGLGVGLPPVVQANAARAARCWAGMSPAWRTCRYPAALLLRRCIALGLLLRVTSQRSPGAKEGGSSRCVGLGAMSAARSSWYRFRFRRTLRLHGAWMRVLNDCLPLSSPPWIAAARLAASYYRVDGLVLQIVGVSLRPDPSYSKLMKIHQYDIAMTLMSRRLIRAGAAWDVSMYI
jgi:hypothetical protein